MKRDGDLLYLLTQLLVRSDITGVFSLPGFDVQQNSCALCFPSGGIS